MLRMRILFVLLLAAFASAQNCSTLCPPCASGFVNQGGTCVPCAAGKYRSASMLSCEDCQPSSFSASGRASCTACATNTFAASGATACTICPSGAICSTQIRYFITQDTVGTLPVSTVQWTGLTPLYFSRYSNSNFFPNYGDFVAFVAIGSGDVAFYGGNAMQTLSGQSASFNAPGTLIGMFYHASNNSVLALFEPGFTNSRTLVICPLPLSSTTVNSISLSFAWNSSMRFYQPNQLIQVGNYILLPIQWNGFYSLTHFDASVNQLSLIPFNPFPSSAHYQNAFSCGAVGYFSFGIDENSNCRYCDSPMTVYIFDPAFSTTSVSSTTSSTIIIRASSFSSFSSAFYGGTCVGNNLFLYVASSSTAHYFNYASMRWTTVQLSYFAPPGPNILPSLSPMAVASIQSRYIMLSNYGQISAILVDLIDVYSFSITAFNLTNLSTSGILFVNSATGISIATIGSQFTVFGLRSASGASICMFYSTVTRLWSTVNLRAVNGPQNMPRTYSSTFYTNPFVSISKGILLPSGQRLVCGAGSADLGYLNCSTCPVGTYANLFSNVACLPCPFGSFANLSGSIFCTTCPPGAYTPSAGATTCAACPSGSSCFLGASSVYNVGQRGDVTSKQKNVVLTDPFADEMANNTAYVNTVTTALYITLGVLVLILLIIAIVLKCRPKVTLESDQETGVHTFGLCVGSQRFFPTTLGGILTVMAIVVVIFLGCALIMQNTIPAFAVTVSPQDPPFQATGTYSLSVTIYASFADKLAGLCNGNTSNLYLKAGSFGFPSVSSTSNEFSSSSSDWSGVQSYSQSYSSSDGSCTLAWQCTSCQLVPSTTTIALVSAVPSILNYFSVTVTGPALSAKGSPNTGGSYTSTQWVFPTFPFTNSPSDYVAFSSRLAYPTISVALTNVVVTNAVTGLTRVTQQPSFGNIVRNPGGKALINANSPINFNSNDPSFNMFAVNFQFAVNSFTAVTTIQQLNIIILLVLIVSLAASVTGVFVGFFAIVNGRVGDQEKPDEKTTEASTIEERLKLVEDRFNAQVPSQPSSTSTAIVSSSSSSSTTVMPDDEGHPSTEMTPAKPVAVDIPVDN